SHSDALSKFLRLHPERPRPADEYLTCRNQNELRGELSSLELVAAVAASEEVGVVAEEVALPVAVLPWPRSTLRSLRQRRRRKRRAAGPSDMTLNAHDLRREPRPWHRPPTKRLRLRR